LWNEADGFYYDLLHLPNGESKAMRLRSMVGLIPLFAVATLDASTLDRFPAFYKRARWFMENRPDYAQHLAVSIDDTGLAERSRLSLVDRSRLERILKRVLDPNEFLSPFGVRALSRVHEGEPYEVEIGGVRHRVAYEPAESSSGLFGGNSNWRGP